MIWLRLLVTVITVSLGSSLQFGFATGSLNNLEHLHNCIRAARRKDNSESREEAGNANPALNNPAFINGGWLDMSKNTPFGLRECTGKFAFQSVAWREAHLRVHHLTVVHRTKSEVLLDALTDLRAGRAASARLPEAAEPPGR